MNITTEKTGIGLIEKPEIEQVEKQKHEYYLLGTFRRTKGLKIFGYDPIKDDLFEVHVKSGENIHLDVSSGKLEISDKEAESVMVDSRVEYFESLNKGSAFNRLLKYKKGIIKELHNLKKPCNDKIKLW